MSRRPEKRAGPDLLERVEGRNAVREALLGPRRVTGISLSSGVERSGPINEILDIAIKSGVPVDEVDRRVVEEMASTAAPQGIVADVEPYRYYSLAEIIEHLEPATDPAVLVLDGVEDPRNLGALIRSADAAGAEAVLVPSHRAAAVTPVVASASAGAVEHVKIARVAGIPAALQKLKEAGLWLMGADERAERPYYEADMALPLAVVLGGEGRGLSRLAKERCDFLVSVPMHGKVSSLNVSVAGSILLFEAARQRETGRRL